MSKHLASVLTTVNAPYSKQLSSAELAYCLSNFEAAKRHSGQVSSFFGEVPLESQLAFASEHDIPLADLKALAVTFSTWSGESYQLAA